MHFEHFGCFASSWPAYICLKFLLPVHIHTHTHTLHSNLFLGVLPTFYLISLIEKVAQPFSWVLYIRLLDMKNRGGRWKSVSLHSCFDYNTHSKHLCMLREYTAEHNDFKQSTTWKSSKPRGLSCTLSQCRGSSHSAALCECFVSCVRCLNCNKAGKNTLHSSLETPIIYPSGDGCSLVTIQRKVTRRCWFAASLTLAHSPWDSRTG